MRRVVIPVVAAGWASIVGLLVFALPASNRYSGRVVAVSEGAEVVVLRNGKPESLRLAEVSFPEKGHPRARAARAFANRLVLGREVAIEETRLPDGSRMAYVDLPDGKNLSAELVRAGLAWPSARHAGRLASSLVALQSRAMSDRRGLWSGAAAPAVARRALAVRVSDSLVSPPAGDAGGEDTDDASLADADAADAGAALGEN